MNAEDNQEIEIADEMKDPAVQKEGGQKGQAAITPGLIGNQSKPLNDIFQIKESPDTDGGNQEGD